MRTTVSTKGQIVLPAELRQQDQIEAGQEFEIERIDRGEYRLVRRVQSMRESWTGCCRVPKRAFLWPLNRSPQTRCDLPRRRQYSERADETCSARESSRVA